MSTYVGYIVSEAKCNPFDVFIPALNGFYSTVLRSADGFGSNMGKWNSLDLADMKAAAVPCYLSSELSPTSDYYYNQEYDLATAEDYLGEITPEKAISYEPGKKAKPAASSPISEEPFYTKNQYPAANYTRTYRPTFAEGGRLPSLLNVPGGTYTTLGIGTRVLVNYPSGGSIGYIIACLPGPDSFSKFIADPRKEN